MERNNKIENIEQLIAMALRPYGNENRYRLNTWGYSAFVNPEEGNAWQDEENALRESIIAPDNWLESPIRHEWLKRKPAELERISYSLTRSVTDWRDETTSLSVELGQQIERIWTVKTRNGYTSRVGRMTLAGILKRLGQKDIGKQISAAKKAEEEKNRLNQQANARNRVREKLAELETAVAQAIKVGCDNLPALFSESLATLFSESHKIALQQKEQENDK